MTLSSGPRHITKHIDWGAVVHGIAVYAVLSSLDLVLLNTIDLRSHWLLFVYFGTGIVALIAAGAVTAGLAHGHKVLCAAVAGLFVIVPTVLVTLPRYSSLGQAMVLLPMAFMWLALVLLGGTIVTLLDKKLADRAKRPPTGRLPLFPLVLLSIGVLSVRIWPQLSYPEEPKTCNPLDLNQYEACAQRLCERAANAKYVDDVARLELPYTTRTTLLGVDTSDGQGSNLTTVRMSLSYTKPSTPDEPMLQLVAVCLLKDGRVCSSNVLPSKQKTYPAVGSDLRYALERPLQCK